MVTEEQQATAVDVVPPNPVETVVTADTADEDAAVIVEPMIEVTSPLAAKKERLTISKAEKEMLLKIIK